MRTKPQALLVFFVSAFASCAGKAPPILPPVALPAATDIELSLFFIGDGGEPAAGGEPVLEALSAELRACETPATAVFLGDNIYPSGMPKVSSRVRPEMERRLKDQIDAVLRTHANGIFVPGNHDWDGSGKDGWSAIRRQGNFIRVHGDGGRVRQLPEHGCPGPEILDLGETVRLVALDTHWWLHSKEKPGPNQCDPGTEEGVVQALRKSLSGDRIAIVVAHHPLLSSGRHGGYFDWRDHLFPLTNLWAPLWVPLPLLGSGYPLARMAGISSQDLSSSKYERLRSNLKEAFIDSPPLLFAGGHEHTLEVLRGSVAAYLLVSGTGFYRSHPSPTRRRETTLYKKEAPGFMRLDVLKDGRFRLGVLEVNAEAVTSERFAMYLDTQ